MDIPVMIFLVAFGLLVVVPVVAILAEGRRKHGARPPEPSIQPDLQRRLERMEKIVAAQQKQMEELKELVHVNIIKMEDMSELHQRLGPPEE